MTPVTRKRQKLLLNYFNVTNKDKGKAALPSTFSHSLEALSLEPHESIIQKEENVVLDTPTNSNTTTPPVIIPENNNNDEEDEGVIIPRKRRLKRTIIEEEEEDSDDEPLSSRLIKLKQKQHNSKHKVKQCDSRIIHDEELNFLDKSDILQGRTRGKQVSRYTEALKKLGDRKSKLDSYQGERGPIEHYSTAMTSDNEDEEEEEEEEEEADLEGFVVDDDMIDGEKNDAAERSEMTMMEMPAEFTTTRTQLFSKQLHIYIEYLIELSLNPIFDISTNSKFQIAKNVVLRRVTSYKDSMVTSDVWLPSFKEAIDKYSNWITVYEEDRCFYLLCGACRANKPASVKVCLSSNTDTTQVEFYLGSECCRKGKLYHQLNHFELHMYNKVKNQVEKQQQQIAAMNNKQIIHENLIQSGYIKQEIKHVKSLCNRVTTIYNSKSQRSRIVDDTSDDDESDNDFTSVYNWSSEY